MVAKVRPSPSDTKALPSPGQLQLPGIDPETGKNFTRIIEYMQIAADKGNP
jgi:hypothetical protein